jgi:hypothetical protein
MQVRLVLIQQPLIFLHFLAFFFKVLDVPFAFLFFLLDVFELQTSSGGLSVQGGKLLEQLDLLVHDVWVILHAF